jgi:hypothetical protein
MNDLYDKLVYKVGSLYTLLSELQQYDLYQGEMTIAYSAGGVEKTLHVYIDGTEMQISDSPGNPGLSFSAGLGGD